MALFKPNGDFPRLKHINPLLDAGVLAFGIFNIILGVAFLFHIATANEFFIINQVTPYGFWGGVFFFGGIALTLGHIMNWWGLMRKATLAMLFVKMIWSVALAMRQVEQPNTNPLLLILFALVTTLQLSGYIYFPMYKRYEAWKH